MGFEIFILCSLFLLFQTREVILRSVNNNCKILNNLQTLKCFGNYPENLLYSANITELQLVNLTWDTLDLNKIIENFANVEKIFLENSDIRNVIVPIKFNKIKVLSLSHNKINKLPKDFVKYLPNLKILSVENNLLKNLDDNFYLGNLDQLSIRSNPWRCLDDLSWALHLNTTIVKDLANFTCNEKFVGKNLLFIAKVKEGMYQNCTKQCECSLENVVQDPRTDKQLPIIMVNCSGRGFTELPKQIPLNTRIMHLERNEISDLRPLKNTPIFKSLWDLYLDNNTVNSISYLEGSHWLLNFRVFSLRGNQLQKLPAFALDNALMKNPNMPKAIVLYLGNNPWRCDCIFVPVFQELVLQKYSSRIPDINDVKCKYVEGDENSLLPIHSLTRSSVCMVPTDFSLQQGLDLLNAILASLIIFVLMKLAYDYYHFKKSGTLPWIVTKLP